MKILDPSGTWLPTVTLTQVIQDVINLIDNPELDYALSPGQTLSTFRVSSTFCHVFSIEIAAEFILNRAEFNRKALECVEHYGLPRT